MPFVSRAQQRWGNSAAGRKALGGQAAVNEWNQATDEGSLPGRKPMAHLLKKVHRVELGRKGESFNVKEGSLHRLLGIPEGEKIGQERLRAATHSSRPAVRRKAIAGIGLTHMHHGG